MGPNGRHAHPAFESGSRHDDRRAVHRLEAACRQEHRRTVEKTRTARRELAMGGAWDQIVDTLRESMIAYAYVFNGNYGAGILAVTFLARLALLPITLRLAPVVCAASVLLC